MFSLLCYNVVDKFFPDQTVIRMSKRQYKVKEIPFPAITFCPDMVIRGHNISISLELYEMLGYYVQQEEVSKLTGFDFYTKFYEDFDFSAESFVPELRRRVQMDWFTKCVLVEWMGQYSVTVNLLLTRHGFCFSFNMHPMETLLRFDK